MQRAFARTTLLVIAIAAAVAIALIVVFSVDISSARDYRADALVRDAFPPGESPPRRFADPSPYAIFVPSEAHVWDSLRGGRLPLWDRMQGGGYSPVVALQGGVFHPVRWLAALAPRELMPGVLIVLALAIALSGSILLGLELGLSRSAAIAAALLFTLSPQLLSYVHFHGSLLPLAHLPWILWLSRRKHFVALTIAFGLMWMAGHLLIALSVLLAALMLARPFLRVAAAAVLGLLLAAFAILPALVAVPDMWTYKTTTSHGIGYRPMNLTLWTIAVRNAVNDAHDGQTCCWVDTQPYYAYLGIFTVLLLLACLYAAVRSRDARVLLVPAVLWFLIAIPGPWMSFLTHVPPFGLLKPWYYAGAFAIFVAFAAAYGLEHLRRISRAAGWIGTAIVVFAIATYAIRGRTVLSPQRWSPAVAGEPAALLRAKGEPFRVTATGGAVHLPNTSRLTGIEDTRLMAPFLPLRFREWWLLVDPALDRKSYPTSPATDVLGSPLVDDFNVAYVLQPRFRNLGAFHTAAAGLRDVALSRVLVEPEFPLVLRTPSLEVRRNSGSGPRAHFAKHVAKVKDLDDAVRILKENPNLVRETAVLETTAPTALPAAARGRVSVHYPDDAHVVLETESDTGGLVVLHDTYARGWSARVDGNDATIHPVNVLSRGVIVPPGRHRVTMAYVPPGLLPGAIVSAIALLLLLLTRHPERRARDLGGRGDRQELRAPPTQVPRSTLGMTQDHFRTRTERSP